MHKTYHYSLKASMYSIYGKALNLKGADNLEVETVRQEK